MNFENAHWRAGHTGRDLMFYEECIGGQWERLTIDGEMQLGPQHHILFLSSPETWQNYPEWARHRRAEIIARLKIAFPESSYEFHGE